MQRLVLNTSPHENVNTHSLRSHYNIRLPFNNFNTFTKTKIPPLRQKKSKPGQRQGENIFHVLISSLTFYPNMSKCSTNFEVTWQWLTACSITETHGWTSKVLNKFRNYFISVVIQEPSQSWYVRSFESEGWDTVRPVSAQLRATSKSETTGATKPNFMNKCGEITCCFRAGINLRSIIFHTAENH